MNNPTANLDQEVQIASQFMASGNIAMADALLRKILSLDPNSDFALNGLGVIAASKGRKKLAMRFFDLALRNTKASEAIKKNVAQCQKQQIVDMDYKAPRPRYLVSKAWGHGFWSDIGHVLGCLLLAEVTFRTPVVLWGAKSRYGSGDGRNAFPLYFSDIGSLAIEDFQKNPHLSYFPSGLNRSNFDMSWPNESSSFKNFAIDFLQRPEDVIVADSYVFVANVMSWLRPSHPVFRKPISDVYRYLVVKYLNPKPWLHKQCQDFLTENFNNAPFHCIHLRGLDKFVEDPKIVETNDRCVDELKSLDLSYKILILTDDQTIAEKMKKEFGSRAIFTQSRKSDSKIGLHLQKGSDPVALGQEILLDSYLASHADNFIGNGGSNVASMISYLKTWPTGTCHIAGNKFLNALHVPSHFTSEKVTFAVPDWFDTRPPEPG